MDIMDIQNSLKILDIQKPTFGYPLFELCPLFDFYTYTSDWILDILRMDNH